MSGTKLTKSKLRTARLAMLDIEQNDGVMMRPHNGRNAAILWKWLKELGWVTTRPVNGSYITDAGRAALQGRSSNQ